MDVWRLRHELDQDEIRDLIWQLRSHGALRLRAGYSDEQLQLLFTKRANRGLLTSLIEVTRGSHEKETLSEILLSEFERMPDAAQWCYAVICACTAKGMPVDAELLSEVVGRLGVSSSYVGSVQFHQQLSDALSTNATDGLRSRHQILASKLVAVVAKLYPILLERVLKELLVVSALQWPNQYLQLLHRRILDLLANDDSAKELALAIGSDASLTRYDRATACGQVGRMLRSHGRAAGALDLINRSIELSPSPRNPAHYLNAHLLVDTGARTDAALKARQIAASRTNARHVAQAAQVFARIGDLAEARRCIDVSKRLESQGRDDNLSILDAEDFVERAANAATSSSRPSRRLESITMEAQSTGLSQVHVDQVGDILRAHPDYRKAVQRIASFVFGERSLSMDETQRYSLMSATERMCRGCIEDIEEGRIAMPKQTRSVLHATAARARYLRERGLGGEATSIIECSEDFRVAIALDGENAWAYLWYAGLLRDTEERSGLAVELSRKALALQPQNVGFVIGLASSLVRSGSGSKNELEEAKSLLAAAKKVATTYVQSAIGSVEIEIRSRFPHA